MGKLNIAHHKSYHPYRRDNIERVRKDEEEARLKEEKEEGRMMLADAEARIAMLRDKAGVSEKNEKKKKRPDDDLKHIASTSSMQIATLPTTNGHINLFEDLELNAIAAAMKVSKKGPAETEKGVPLAPSAKDLKPWYSEKAKDKPEENVEDDKKKREESRKFAHDPLTSITKQLASREGSSSSRSFKHPSSTASMSDKPPEVRARLSRETSERERALELIRRKRREMDGNATPSTVSGEPDSGYGDMFNRREVEDAHRHRDRRRDNHRSRRWDDDERNRSRPTRHW